MLLQFRTLVISQVRRDEEAEHGRGEGAADPRRQHLGGGAGLIAALRSSQGHRNVYKNVPQNLFCRFL